MTKGLNLIGISGHIGTGKDEVARIIEYLTSECSNKDGSHYRTYEKFTDKCSGNGNPYESWYNSPWENKKFSYKLKRMAALALGCSVESFENREFKNTLLDTYWDIRFKTTARFFVASKEVFDSSPMTVRHLLQKIGNGLRETVHPDFWINSLFSDWDETEDKWAISDVRYLNEVEAIKSRGGIVIKVNRSNVVFTTTNHISETELNNFEDWDWIIDNSGTIDDLVANVRKMLKNFKII